LRSRRRDTAFLASLASQAADELGRSVSVSAVLGAILRLVAKEMIPAPAIIEFVERELESGRRWRRDQKTSLAGKERVVVSGKASQ